MILNLKKKAKLYTPPHAAGEFRARVVEVIEGVETVVADTEWNDNVVTSMAFLRMLEQGRWNNGSDTVKGVVGKMIDNGPDKHFLNAFMPVVDASANQQANYPQWAYDITPRPEIVFYARINPPPSGTRTINYLGLRNTNGSNHNGMFAYTTLNVNITQNSVQFVDLYYRLFVNDDLNVGTDTVAPAAFSALILAAAGLSLEDAQFNFANAQAKLLHDSRFGLTYQAALSGTMFEKTGTSDNIDAAGATNVLYPWEGSAERTFSLTEGDLIGTVIGGFAHIAGAQIPFLTPMVNADSPFQHVFNHAAGADSPFTDLAALGTSPGTIVRAGTWEEDDFPQMVHLMLQTTGDIGVATYRVRVRRFTGFVGSSYQPAPAVPHVLPSVPVGTTTPVPQYGAKSVHGFNLGVTTADADAHQHAQTQAYRTIRVTPTMVASFSDTGVTLYNGAQGAVAANIVQTFDADSTPDLTVTEINQIAAGEDQYLYVACGTDGLKRIDVLAGTVTDLAGPSGVGITGGTCYAVATKADGSLWGIFEGTLAKSTDQGDTWTNYNTGTTDQFDFTGITDGNWSTVNQIIVDPYDADDRLLFIQNATSVWWDRAGSNPTSNAVAGPAGRAWLFTNKTAQQHIGFLSTGEVMAVLDNSSVESRLYELTYGTATVTAVVNDFNDEGHANLCIVAGADGDDYVLRMRSTGADLLDAAGSVAYTVLETDADNLLSAATYMGNGVLFGLSSVADFGKTALSGNQVYGWLALGTADPFDADTKDVSWLDYGWDGASWVLDDVGYRATHGTAQAIPTGITVQFVNDPGGNSFVTGEDFTFGLCRGLLKDDSTQVNDVAIPVYIYPTTVNESDLTAATVPASNEGAMVDDPVGFGMFDPPSVTVTANTAINATLGALSGGNDVSTSRVGVCASEQVLNGNCSVNFVLARGHINKAIAAVESWGIGLIDAATIITEAGLPFTAFTEGFTFEYLATNQVRVRIRHNGAVVYNQVHTPYGVAGTDPAMDFQIERNGSDIEYFIDGVSVYTNTTVGTDLRVIARAESVAGLLAYDIKASYTSARRLIGLGDVGSETGRYKEGFNRIPSYTGSLSSLVNVLLAGNPPAEFHVDGVTAPAAGEVTLLPAIGKLWFNTVDAGDSVSANYAATYQPGTAL